MLRNETALLPQKVSQDRENVEDRIAEQLKETVGPQVFAHWFRGKASIEVADNRVTVVAANPFLSSWLQHRFRADVAGAAQNVLGAAADVRFKARTPKAIASARDSNPTALPTIVIEPATPQFPCASPVEFDAGGCRTGAIVKSVAADVDRHAVALKTPSAATAQKLRDAGSPTSLGSALRNGCGSSVPSERRFADLADFVTGPCNQLAMTAAVQICEQPGGRYNPLVIFGGVGTGKTHLLEGIYRRLRAFQPRIRAMFLSAETFANFFTQSLRERSLPSFRQRFRSVDALIVDDVDFLDGKRVIQEEFLHTIKQLESHQRQIVLSADRHPRLLTKLSDELVTRFIAGLVCRLEPPDLATRRAIIARKAARLGDRVAEEALEFVAQRFKTSVREMEGALNCLETYGSMIGKTVSLSAARQVLADLDRDCVRAVGLAEVETAVCEVFAVHGDELRSQRRSRSVSQPRMLAMYLARRMTPAAYSEIGEHFGGRNHSTVMSAEKRVRKMLASDTSLRVAAQTWKISDLVKSLEQQLMTG